MCQPSDLLGNFSDLIFARKTDVQMKLSNCLFRSGRRIVINIFPYWSACSVNNGNEFYQPGPKLVISLTTILTSQMVSVSSSGLIIEDSTTIVDNL